MYHAPHTPPFRHVLALNRSVRASDCFHFERGPESIIRRLQIKDIQGRVLEDIDQYNMVYAITELCTADPETRGKRSAFYLEGGSGPYEDLGGWIKHPTLGFQQTAVVASGGYETISFDLTFTPFSAVFGGGCEKYLPLSVMEGLEIHLQLENPSQCLQYAFVPYPVYDGSSAAMGDAGTANYTNLVRATTAAIDVYAKTWTSHMAYGKKHATGDTSYTETEVNTELDKWSAHNAWLAGEGGDYKVGMDSSTPSTIRYTVTNPRLLLSCLDVEPSVNAALVSAAKDPRDGMIRIQTFSWMTLSTMIPAGHTGEFNWVLPISVTSLKSIFFTLTNTTKLNSFNHLKTKFEHRGLQSYEFRVGGLPINADMIIVDDGTKEYNTYSQAIDTLMEAWGVHHKTDANATLLTRRTYAPAQWNPVTGYYERERNALFGQELESFSQKSGIIQSGINTMQTTFQMRLMFGTSNKKTVRTNDAINIATSAGKNLANESNAAAYTKVQGSEECVLYSDSEVYELRAYCMYDKVIAFDENSGSIRSEY